MAVRFGLAATEAVADRRSGFQTKQWDIYSRLYKKVVFLALLELILDLMFIIENMLLLAFVSFFTAKVLNTHPLTVKPLI